MKFFSITIQVATRKPFDFVKIDTAVNKVIRQSKIKNGFVLLRSPHNTATIICNEDDPTVLEDMKKTLKKLLPDNFSWSHNYEGVDNARAHQAVALLGHTHWVPLENGKLKLGAWQSFFLVEFFQARSRKVEITTVGQ